MKINEIHAIITGATGGIGSQFAKQLVSKGAKVLLVARDHHALTRLQTQLLAQDKISSEQVSTFACDLLESDQRAQLLSHIAQSTTTVNCLINSAGANEFAFLKDTSEEKIESIIQLNTLAPILLSKALLPYLAKQKEAQIINIGSTFGSIGYPGFSSYCASKYALRGFSEALRRELSHSKIKVKYLAPRSTNTTLTTANILAMNKALNVAMDSPERVAEQLIHLIESDKNELAIGLPETIFSKLNQLLPSLVSKVISKQLPTIKRYASPH